MVLVFSLVVAVVGLIVMFPDTQQARFLRRWLVEGPAGALNRLRPGRLVFYGGLAVGGLVLTLLFEMEGLRLFGMLLPDTLVWFALFDVGVFVDALLITTAVLASNGLSVMRRTVADLACRARAVFVRRGGRARRPARPKRPRPSSSDDDRPAGWGQPAYRAFSMA